jgi:tetratricopeptide (TPR) repeat protein
LLLPLGAVGILTLAWGGFWLGTRASQNQASPDWLPEVSSLIPNESSANLARLNTAELTAEATSALNQNDLTMGEQAVIQLLDRGALEQARSALAAVPADRTDDPAISFLSGRQAWQAIAAGNPDYSFDDARRYWESAIQQQPNQPEYHQALGFAYYAEGKSREAIATWQQALDLLKAQSDSPDEEPSPELLKNPAALHAYAGMALALQKAASQYGPAERDELLSKAEKLYQMVMDADSMQFQPNALARSENWLWTEEAIADWQTLGKRVP